MLGVASVRADPPKFSTLLRIDAGSIIHDCEAGQCDFSFMRRQALVGFRGVAVF